MTDDKKAGPVRFGEDPSLIDPEGQDAVETEQPAAELPTGMVDAIKTARDAVGLDLTAFLGEEASEQRKRELIVSMLQARHRQKAPNGHWRIS
jgi:hypothetical protein